LKVFKAHISPTHPPIVDATARNSPSSVLVAPNRKERLSKTVERGSIGALVKQATGFKCQLCEALGLHPVGFLKKNGEPYVEAHHVMPVSKREVGSLSAYNIMTHCANHHRQMHYGGIDVVISATTFDFIIGGTPVKIPKLRAALNRSF
jgi:predicted HNH restriction endonuclease